MTGGGPHIPVLIDAIVSHCAPIKGHWVDGTFGAGGYTRALLNAGADKVTAVDRDPLAFELAAPWEGAFRDRLEFREGLFSQMTEWVGDPDGVDGVVLDLGVSSMQLDMAERGFSFMRDGPLDMRMSQSGPSAADIVNTASAEALADILYVYGEERASRRIAAAIVRARATAPISTTTQLAELVSSCLPRPKPGQSHPATRSFQALRIAVNDEYRELARGLLAAEQVLRPGGQLAVVSFHSIEDRIVKRFIQARSDIGGGNRHAPPDAEIRPQFTQKLRKASGPDADELARNPRARSAKLRVGIRTDSPAGDALTPGALGLPILKGVS